MQALLVSILKIQTTCLSPCVQQLWWLKITNFCSGRLDILTIKEANGKHARGVVKKIMEQHVVALLKRRRGHAFAVGIMGIMENIARRSGNNCFTSFILWQTLIYVMSTLGAYLFPGLSFSYFSCSPPMLDEREFAPVLNWYGQLGAVLMCIEGSKWYAHIYVLPITSRNWRAWLTGLGSLCTLEEVT